MRVEPAVSVQGHVVLPGDKSISHRALLVAAVAEGTSRIRGFGRSGDTESTLAAVRALGVEVEEPAPDELVVHGVGLRGLRPPDGPVDCGNAGTLLRLLAGLLAGSPGEWELTGDESLRSRPMERVAEPLRRMGADVETTAGTAPVRIRGGELRPVDYLLPVASAQVKSAVLLAGLHAAGRTTVVEPAPTRDHTEILLAAAGVPVRRRAASCSVDGPARVAPFTVDVPGDPSSAAPLVVAATLLAGSELTLHRIGLNPRRAAYLDVVERMGGRISVFARTRGAGEPAGDVEVRSAPLTATRVEPAEVPGLIDELPLLALAAAMARGETVFRGVEELRVKESDRLGAVVDLLRAVGARASAGADTLSVRGVPTRVRGGKADARGDHRLAILGGVAGLVSREGVTVEGAGAAAVSFPGFWDLLDSVRTR